MNFFRLSLLIMITFFHSNIVFSAGSSSEGSGSVSMKSKSTSYYEAEKFIKNEQFSKAIDKLNDALFYDNKDADIYNYLGFSYRKINQLDKASTYYKKALEINPKHKGALEYQGEMFITLNQIKDAENNLKILDKICFLGCTEFFKLKKSIENAKKGKKNSY